MQSTGRSLPTSLRPVYHALALTGLLWLRLTSFHPVAPPSSLPHSLKLVLRSLVHHTVPTVARLSVPDSPASRLLLARATCSQLLAYSGHSLVSLSPYTPFPASPVTPFLPPAVVRRYPHVAGSSTSALSLTLVHRSCCHSSAPPRISSSNRLLRCTALPRDTTLSRMLSCYALACSIVLCSPSLHASYSRYRSVLRMSRMVIALLRFTRSRRMRPFEQ